MAKKKTARDLTSKQRHFTRAWASGMSLSDSYKEAFDVSDSTTAASVHTLASRLASKVEIRSRYEQLIAERDRQIARTAVSRRDKLVNWLDDVVEGKMLEEPSAVRMRAAELLGRSVGAFQENLNISSGSEKNASEIASEIEALLVKSQAEEAGPEEGEELH
ncbi:MAG: hypothetical protein CMF55_06790 [Legionellales bacterium]|nr:hypothetical protein [Legionellales bacterium]|tara:strand:+ start:151 stop:636 length:486 start_codon:yes stop_codon:yes gene_type:complete